MYLKIFQFIILLVMLLSTVRFVNDSITSVIFKEDIKDIEVDWILFISYAIYFAIKIFIQ